MNKAKKESFFWTSYSDLMTSLFFVMLVLFVLVIVLLHNKMAEIEEERKASDAQLEKIKEIEEAINTIDSTYFDYNKDYKKHILKIRVNFPLGQSNMNFINSQTQEELVRAGKSIQKSIEDINREYPTVQYLLIIEGQASNDNYPQNYELSYKRALALKRFWIDENNITFGDNCEILISGSGIEGTMRETIETQNQRFLIHIVPKPGTIEASKK
jgi:outer membrane protein OmpA-like peptidoglycan-associated protein